MATSRKLTSAEMEVVLISNYFPPGFIGGYELGALDFATWLTSQGASVHVLTSATMSAGSTDPLPESIRVTRELSLSSAKSLSEEGGLELLVSRVNLERVAQALGESSAKAVYCFGLSGLGAPGLLRYLELSGVTTVAVFMDDPLREIPRNQLGLARAAFGAIGSGGRNSALTTFSMSKGLTRELRESGLEGEIRQFAGWAQQSAAQCDGQERRAAGTQRPFRFVYSSRVAPHKGISLLLEACQQLRAADLTQFEVDIFGDGMVAEAMTLAAGLGVDDLVRYRGSLQKSEMIQRFSEYDALLFPTWEREPFGFVVAEAASAGCVPIVTASIGAAEWLLDGVDSLKCRRTPTAFADAIAYFMHSSTESRVLMSRRARRTAQLYFQPELWMQHLAGPLLQASNRPDPHLLNRLSRSFTYLGLELSRPRVSL